MRTLNTRPIRSVLAARKMFANGGMVVPAASGILASSQPLMQAAGQQEQFSQPMGQQGQSFVDSIVQDAVNPQGGGTLAMAEGGVATFRDGGQYLMGMKPVQLQVPMDAPVTRETYGLAPIHEGQSFGQSAGSIDYSKIMVPSITPRIGRKGLEIGAPPIEISAEQLKTESPRQKYDRMAPATLSSPWSVEFYDFDKANPKFEAAKRAQAAKTGKAYSRAEVAGAKAWAMLHGGLGVLSSGAADVLNTAHDWFFGRGNPTEKEFMQIMVLDEFKQRRPDLAKDIDAMGKIILGNAPDISGAKLEETIANALSNKYELGHQIAAEDVALEDIDRGVTPLDQRQRQQLTEAGVPDDMVEDVLLYMNQNWEANPTIEDATAFVRGTREEVVAEAARSASAEAAKELGMIADWPDQLGTQPGQREFRDYGGTQDISGADSLPPVTTEDQASPEWMGLKPEVPEGTRSTVVVDEKDPLVPVEKPIKQDPMTGDARVAEAAHAQQLIKDAANAGDTKKTTEGLEAFVQEFKDAIPDYEGKSEFEQGMDIVKMGMAIAAGESPNAITNISKGVMATIDNFTSDEKERRAYKRQVDLSAGKYALTNVARSRANDLAIAKERRTPFTEIFKVKKGESFTYNGKVYGAFDTVIALTGDVQDGSFPLNKVETQTFTVEALKAANAKIKANLDIIKDATRDPDRFMTTAEKYGENSNRVRSNIMIQGLLNEAGALVVSGEVTGIIPSLKNLGQMLANATGGRWVPDSWKSLKQAQYKDRIGRAITGNITSLLNEGNRTVSDPDRERADAIGGAFADYYLAPTFANQSLLLDKIRDFSKNLSRDSDIRLRNMGMAEKAWASTYRPGDIRREKTYADILRESRSGLEISAGKQLLSWRDIIDVNETSGQFSYKRNWLKQ